MCNAFNHDNGCECGFGPPYTFSGNANIVEKVKWGEQALWDEEEFVRGLNEVIPDKKIASDIQEQYKQQGFPLQRVGLRSWKRMSAQRKRAFTREMKKILGMVRIKKGKPIKQTIRVPLFKLHSPCVPGSKVTYMEDEAVTKTNWNISLGFPGFGMGSRKTIKVSYSCRVSCKEGCCKIISMPLEVIITPLEVFDRNGKLINKSLQVEAAAKNNKKQFQRAVHNCEEDPCKDRYASMLDLVDLLNDTSGDAVEVRIRLTGNRKRYVQVGISAFGLEAAVQATVEFESVLEIESTLPPRRLYKMYNIMGEHGIMWRVKDPLAV